MTDSGQGIGGLLGNSGAGRLLGGVLSGTTDQGIGVHVTGTASTPSFKIDPTAVTSLLKAGLAGSKTTGSQAVDASTSGKSSRKKDVPNSLLQGALGSKKGH